MSQRVERMIKDYPSMVKERNCIRYQLENFRGITENEIIDSMNFSSPQDERVQTSNISDKTAKISECYRDRVRRINQDWVNHLSAKLMALEEEIDFFLSALRAISPELASLMWDLIVEQMTWDDAEAKYHVCRATIGKYRKKAICELDALYASHDKEMADYILR